MRLIIAGKRDFHFDHDFIHEALYASRNYGSSGLSMLKPTEIVSGTCNGIDKSGEKYAEMWQISLKRFPADWDTYGKAAGPIRNRQMAEYGDALLLIWDGESRGSANMKKEMLKLNKPVYEVILKQHNIEDEEEL